MDTLGLDVQNNGAGGRLLATFDPHGVLLPLPLSFRALLVNKVLLELLVLLVPE